MADLVLASGATVTVVPPAIPTFVLAPPPPSTVPVLVLRGATGPPGAAGEARIPSLIDCGTAANTTGA